MTSTIESSVIDEFGYNEPAQELTIRFRNGGGGIYSGVPREIVGAMLSAPSAGSYFAHNIRNSYTYRAL